MLEFFFKGCASATQEGDGDERKEIHRRGWGYGQALAEAKIAADMSALVSAQLHTPVSAACTCITSHRQVPT
jgi:hypothetical protein